MITHHRIVEYLNSCDLTPNQLRALIHAIAHINEGGTMRVPNGDAAVHIGMHVRTYRSAMRTLVEQGYLNVQHRPGYEHLYTAGARLGRW